MKHLTMQERLAAPTHPVDVVLDTDTYNEIDDQFALAYLLRSGEKLTTRAVYAAPFFNELSSSPADGMEKSYQEILKVLGLCEREDLIPSVYRGSTDYLADEKTPHISDAAKDLAERAMHYTMEDPLYVVAIGAITNVASALLLRPEIADRIVIVWLGGHSREWENTREFNMKQDIAAVRVVFSSGAPVVQLPCLGVVSSFMLSRPELEAWFVGVNPVADYLATNTIAHVESNPALRGRPWRRVIWDATAVAWLFNENEKMMREIVAPARLPTYEGVYGEPDAAHPIKYIYHINTANVLADLFDKLRK